MKKILTLTTIIVLTTIFVVQAKGQPWNSPVRLTTGYIDKNPCFGNNGIWNFGLFAWEFMAFERKDGPNNCICVLKINLMGVVDTVTYIVRNTYSNRNPCIDYENHTSSPFPPDISNSMLVWESNQSGNWDVYGSKWNVQTGWTNPEPIVNTSENEIGPRVINIDTGSYALVYEKNNDIYFKLYDNQVWLPDTNLTAFEPENCSHPNISLMGYIPPNPLIVTYEKQVTNTQKKIMYRITSDFVTWSQPDTIASLGINRNCTFSFMWDSSFYPATRCIFESSREGNWNIYMTTIKSTNFNKYQQCVIRDQNTQNKNYVVGAIFPGWFQWTFTYSFLRISHDSIFVRIGDYQNIRDSIFIDDTSKQTTLCMNRGVLWSFDAILWTVYNKDSANYTNLYAYPVNWHLEGVQKISSEIPNGYKLSQNYPNPFNPVTKIKFDVPLDSRLRGNDIVILKIFDVLGREIATLVNEKLQPGSYETEWDASNYPSGVYFCKLITPVFSETRKMVLVK